MLIRSVVAVAALTLAACAPEPTGGSAFDTSGDADWLGDIIPGDVDPDVEVFAPPRMVVLIDDQEVSDGHVARFDSLFFSSTKTVAIQNDGDGPLRVIDVRWDVDGAGSPRKNAYVALDLRGANGPFPLDLVPGNLDSVVVSVALTPPAGRPLDDVSDSVLVIESNDPNARFVRVTFEVGMGGPTPRVSPERFTFTSATHTRPEVQSFRIYNDSSATDSFAILSVALESPSSELRLSDLPMPGYVVRAPGDPSYQDVIFELTYMPLDNNTDDSNAIIIETDLERLRVPISTDTVTGSYSLTFSHADELDFGGARQGTTRSVVITSGGPGPLVVRRPFITPQDEVAFTYIAWLVAADGGPDTELVSWPRALAAGGAVRLDVQRVGPDGIDGTLVIPVETAAIEMIEIPLR